MGTVYLLHFDKPYKHARHYIGYADRLKARLQHHEQGTGARLMQVLKENGITWQLARVWKKQDRHFERSLKNKKCTPKLCPICRDHKKRVTH